MKKFRRILIYILLLSVILCGAALALHYAQALPALIGPREVSVHGTVTRDGKPLEWSGGERRLLVIFFPLDRQKNLEIYPAECDAQKGTYSIAKIPAGTYKVAVQQNVGPLKDLLALAFDPAHTTLERTVTDDGQEIAIDLPKDLPKVRAPAIPKGRPDDNDKTEPK